MSNRTTRTFRYDNEIWPVLEKWAKENGFRLKSSSKSERLYQKGDGIWVAPMMLSVEQIGKEVTLEAWVRLNFLYQIMTVFLSPTEVGVESGGFLMVTPRRIARNAINKLLFQLGQKTIP